jgi:hypothetical protein
VSCLQALLRLALRIQALRRLALRILLLHDSFACQANNKDRLRLQVNQLSFLSDATKQLEPTKAT